MPVLVVIADEQEPFHAGPREAEQRKGVTLRLAESRDYHLVAILEPPSREEATRMLRESLAQVRPGLTVEVRPLPVRSLYEQDELLDLLEQEVRSLLSDHGPGVIEVGVGPDGEPTTRAWLRLAQTRDLPVSLYRFRVPPFPNASPPLLECLQAPHQAAVSARPLLVLRQPDAQILEAVARSLGCIGDHPRYLRALDAAGDIADHQAPVFLRGEEGSGRQQLARLIHQMSDRRDAPFVSVNAAYLPLSYVESVLFGHRKGAFAGARFDHRGKCLMAAGGTLFIAGVESLLPAIQERLVSLIRTGRVHPLGADRPEEADLRLIFAGPRAEDRPPALIPELAAHLKECEIVVPSLRERPTDVPKVALYLLSQINAALRTPKQLSRQSLEFLEKQIWPRNILDLRVVLERAALYAQTNLIEPRHLEEEERTLNMATAGLLDYPLPELTEDFSLESFISRLRSRLMQKALEDAEGNQSEAARLLKISPQAVHQFLKKQRR